MTEWVTVKIHEETRDEAREDSRTYTEIMEAGLGTDPVAQVEVDGESIRDEIEQAVHDQLDQITINVDMGGLDLDGSDLTAEDVESIVTREIEKHVHERARQKL